MRAFLITIAIHPFYRVEGLEVVGGITIGYNSCSLHDVGGPIVLRPGQRLIATLTVGEQMNTLTVEVADAEEADAPAIVEGKT